MDTTLASILGDRTAKALQGSFGYATVGDLLQHYPRRYASRGELTPIAEVPVGEVATLVGEVVEVKSRSMRAKRGSVLEVTVTDGTGLVTLTFFNQAWRAKDLLAGARGIFAGKVGLYRGQRQLAHPDYELFEAEPPAQEAAEEWARRPIPLYPATQKVASWQIARAVGVILDVLEGVSDPIPERVRSSEGLMPYLDALHQIHRPADSAQSTQARQTLRFHEAFVLQCALVQRRRSLAELDTPPRTPGALVELLRSSLPFALTDDQERVVAEITADMASGHPMTRLVQGEVGSGKTVVALIAMLTVAESGGQAALLAPTEVLAWQHFRSIVATLGPDLAAEVNPVLLTGALPAAAKKKAHLAVASGVSRIVVGTHALIADRVAFADLGLVVIDEQHRFGVDQRDALRLKGTHPHTLVLTATPIPRTVAMTVFGDLEVSTIATLPAGRRPISTHVVAIADNPGWYPRIWQRLAEEVASGRQGFVVVPAITAGTLEAGADEDAPDDDAAAPATIEQTLPMLQSLPELQGFRIQAVHGRMPSDEKDSVMREFAAGRVDVLVATTVIEVGIDVPNASTMVVLDADRFGVSQLHQLRGRIGRGEHAGVCLLVSTSEPGTPARARVDAVAATQDGFELAHIDLELRREGDVLGRAQSGGRSGLRLLRVTKDAELIERARELALALVGEDPGLGEHPELAADIRRRLGPESADYLEKN